MQGLVFHGNNGYANAVQFYVTRTSPVVSSRMGLPPVGSIVAICELEITGHDIIWLGLLLAVKVKPRKWARDIRCVGNRTVNHCYTKQ